MSASRRTALCSLAALLVDLPAAPASYPRKPITWIVPFSPGGVSDSSSRAVAQRVGVLLGQPVVIDYRPGAGGSLGTEQVARAAADGYTVLYASSGTMAANLALYRHLRYRPLVDFAPVHGLFESSTLLLVGAQKPWRTVDELLIASRNSRGALNYGSAGTGTGTHLVAELLQARAGVRWQHVPYKGASAALTDLLAGRLDLMFDYPPSVLPHLQVGSLRTLAVMGRTRLVALPTVQTIAQAGQAGADLASWSAVVAPAGTPAAIVAVLSRAIGEALLDASIVDPLIALGVRPLHDMDADALRQHIGQEIGRWADVVKRSGATLE